MTIPAALAAAAERFGDRRAIVDGDMSLTYAELRDRARVFAGAITPGSRVAIWAPNSWKWIVAVLGLWEAGATLVPINTRFKGPEADVILQRSGASLLVTVGDFMGVDYASTVTVDVSVLRVDTDEWDGFGGVAPDVTVTDDDVSDILFTSGTTGVPKGVVMTHGRTLQVATDWVAMTGLNVDDRYLMVNPYFHMFGLKAGILACVVAGATMYPEPVFDVDRALTRVAEERITVFPGAPTLYQSILDHPARAEFDLTSLRVAVTGAADIPVELIRRIDAELPFSTIITGYGLTEAGTVSATSPDDDAETIATTVGRARPGYEIQIVNDEVLVLSSTVMAGYLDDPEATADALTDDGWLHTGDLGVLDERGNLRIIGRSKDMFIVGGFNAYPAEIENAMLRHPDVAQVAVIGVPDERLGEVGMAFVVTRSGDTTVGPAIAQWCRDEMANYKAPRVVEIVESLPVNATGKVVKDELRARVGLPRVIHESLERAAERFGDRVAILADDDSWSFRDLVARRDVFAAWLVDRGVQAGDRVALQLTNRVEFVLLVNAISKLGAASVLLSPAWKQREVDHALSITNASLLVTDDDLDSPDFGYLTDGRPSLNYPKSEEGEGGEAILVFSSGTTGLPKAVRHTHGSIGAGTRHWVAALGLGPEDRFQVATPPSHILGLLNLLAAAAAGATVRLHKRFDLDEVLHRIEVERMTLEMAVAPIALAMANHPKLETFDLSSLRYIMWGATPVTESVARTVTERTGVRFMPAYGASELPVIACNPIDDPAAWRLDSAGLPPKEVDLRVVDLDTGTVLDSGGIGEIQARSTSLMAGYLPDDANADAFDDGWYRTGDVGWLEPAGWVHLTDRSKEMIKVNGFQVAPAEIEAVLHGHPSVLDCAVFGIADESAGEVPVAAVQLDSSNPVSEDELVRLVADSLATYKHLRRLVVVDTIPRLPSGKVLRRTLRDEWVSISRNC